MSVQNCIHFQLSILLFSLFWRNNLQQGSVIKTDIFHTDPKWQTVPWNWIHMWTLLYNCRFFFSQHQNRKLMDCSPNTDCPLRLPLHWVFQPVFSISSFCLISLIYSSALHFPSVSLEAPNDQLLGISKHFFKFSAILVSVRLRDVPTKSILQ